MSIFDNIRNWFLAPLLDNGGEMRMRLQAAEERRQYREGRQRRYLKPARSGVDDNLIVNYAGLVIDRSISMLLGGGVTFDLPGDGETPADRYIQAVMDANKQEILLHKACLLASEQGTGYIKIIPDALPYTPRTPETVDEAGNTAPAQPEEMIVPRLVVLDPAIVTIQTRPDDVEDVLRYIITYVVTEGNTTIARRQTIERNDGVEVGEDGQASITAPQSWTIIDEESRGGMPFVVVGRQAWEYEFPPILHWQNLPDPTSPYGAPDLTPDVIELQDRVNFLASNLSKLVRLYAHPMRYGRGIPKEDVQTGPGEMPVYNSPDAKIEQLDANADLVGAQQFLLSLRQSLFDITQTVDMTSMADKVGALTNFGLRVLYADALAKLGVKQRLFGDALLELVRRLLVLGGHEPDPGEIVWPDPLPVNEDEQARVLETDMRNGLVSKQTASERRGYDWTVEEERMTAERQAAQEQQQSLGAFLLRDFNGGGGGGLFGSGGQQNVDRQSTGGNQIEL
jgi:hypothetical protein